MAKLTAWLVTLIGVLLVLGLLVPTTFDMEQAWIKWVISLAVLVIGIGKLVRNYSSKRR